MGLSRDESVSLADPRAEASVRPDLERLFDEHADFVHRAVCNLAGPMLDAEDLVQDVFVNACRGWSAFERRSSERTWLYGIALGVVANARRRARLRRFVGLDHTAEPPAPALTAPEDLEREQTRRSVHALIDKLSEKKRTALVLFDLEGLSGEEVAAIVGCPLPTFWSRLHHARLELAQHVKRAEQIERARAGRTA